MYSFIRYPCAAGLFALASFACRADAADSSVPYVPTPQEVVERMLEMAKVGPQDYLIDLGSGDGRIVVTAAKKFGTRGFGVDLNPVRIKESVENAASAGVSERVAFHQRDLFDTELGDASVITMYLLPRVNLLLRPKLLELKPGTRIVSHDFDMDDWKPDESAILDVREKYGSAGGNSSVYLWVVPAKAAGAWRWQLTIGGKPQSYELALEQRFQVISGAARVGGRSVALEDARLRSDQISFSFTADVNGGLLRHVFSGRVVGNAIEGTVNLLGSRTQGQLEWNATRGAKSALSLTCSARSSLHAGAACRAQSMLRETPDSPLGPSPGQRKGVVPSPPAPLPAGEGRVVVLRTLIDGEGCKALLPPGEGRG